MRLGIVIGALGLTACSGADTYYVPVGGSYGGSARTVSIDTDAQIDPGTPGEGVGVFVEYAAGGSWRIRTSCDVLLEQPCDYDPTRKCPPPDCSWDIVATSLAGSLDVASADVDSVDEVRRVDDSAVRLLFDTGAEIDGVELTADPGEKLNLDVYLDGYYDGSDGFSHVFWVSEGTVDATGAPSNPVVFSPTSP